MIHIRKSVADRIPDIQTMAEHQPKRCGDCSFFFPDCKFCEMLNFGFDSDFDARNEVFLGCPWEEIASNNFIVKDDKTGEYIQDYKLKWFSENGDAK